MPSLSHKTDCRAASSPPNTATRADKPLVLIVEDHEDTRFMLRYWIEMRGCLVVEALDGEEAVEMAERCSPDLILMDLDLPRVDGLMATRRIRQHTTLGHVPVVFLSGYAQPDFRAAASAAGGDDYLVKPFQLSELKTAMEKFLSKRELKGN